ncbi:TetR family transcriptional regulator [Kribbella qitaiheensis]|uniref:TetR family transcriptional regulator n=1 Tax=Kribbella qitaiheensis TaxID=1544730 RepID=A0A7G6X2U5_9ACTN|nr:TetR family transcriptional regulator [Kribbella qitaiheensis]QNE20560.1 TetR family transcriptional regulator [Kribbella qitaiheensis]
MSTPYEAGGRSRQKQRTRDALVQAAKALVATGVAPTIEEAAAAAGISRPTAYRYFPNQRTLLAAAHPETGATSMLPADPPPDVASRLALAIRTFTGLILETEAQQRTMLRLSLEADPAERAELPLRQGRAIGWFEEALAPLRDELGDEAIRRLAVAIRSAVGIEALSWLTDIARLSRDDAVETMTWSAQSMLHAALAGRLPPETIGNTATAN